MSVRDLAPPDDIPVCGDDDAMIQPGIAGEPSQNSELAPAERDQSEPRGAIVNPSGAPLGVTDEAGDTLVLRPNVDVESRVPLRRLMRGNGPLSS